MSSRLTLVLVSLLLVTPVLVFWSWLVVLPARVAILCPEECRCDPEGYHVKCHGPSYTADPSMLFREVRILEIRVKNLSVLRRDSFVSLNELEMLRVYPCGLRTIELGAFNGLTKLTQLYISRNEISEILPDTFENMSSLEHLLLINNRIEHLHSDVFSGLVNLKHIVLESNKLKYLHPDTFLGLPNLQSVSLFGNTDLDVPTDSPFINSHSLSYLDISGCYVSSVSVETFANVSALEWLDLCCNDLTTVDINIFRALPKLFKLFLYENPLECDCQLQEVWRWCEDRNIETSYSEILPQCDTPSEVGGMWWGVLENGECLEDNTSIIYYADYENTSHTYTDTEILSEEVYDSEFLKHYQVPIFAVPFIFGTAGNAILLIIIICNKDMRTVPNMYILNLATSDILYLTMLFSEACAKRISDTWLDSDFLCRFLPFYSRMSVGLSVYSVAMLSMQRYRVTVNPFHVRVSSPPTWRGIMVKICGVWILAAFFALPSAISNFRCREFHAIRRITYYQHVVIFELLVSCVLPLCVIAFTYIKTARHLVISSRPISEGTQMDVLKTRSNNAKIVIGLFVVFMISYVPYHVLWSYIIWTVEEESYFERHFHVRQVLKKDTELIHYSNYKIQFMYLISTCFLSLNSCLNPVALFCTSSPFRDYLKRYITRFCKTNSPPNDMELRRRN